MSDYEPLNPVQIESKLRSLVTEMTKAQQALAKQRDIEVGAEISYQRARDAVETPPVVRGGFTVAERDALIDRVTRDEWEAWRRATETRKSAEDYLRVVREQASVVQSLARSVTTAYGLAGVS